MESPPYRGPSALQSARIIGARSPATRRVAHELIDQVVRGGNAALIPVCAHGALIDCSIKVYNLYSRRRAGKVYPHEIDIQQTTPSIVNLTVKRCYLTQREIERLMDC